MMQLRRRLSEYGIWSNPDVNEVDSQTLVETVRPEYFSWLPDEVLVIVVNFLELKDHLAFSLVCSRFYNASRASFSFYIFASNYVVRLLDKYKIDLPMRLDFTNRDKKEDFQLLNKPDFFSDQDVKRVVQELKNDIGRYEYDGSDISIFINKVTNISTKEKLDKLIMNTVDGRCAKSASTSEKITLKNKLLLSYINSFVKMKRRQISLPVRFGMRVFTLQGRQEVENLVGISTTMNARELRGLSCGDFIKPAIYLMLLLFIFSSCFSGQSGNECSKNPLLFSFGSFLFFFVAPAIALYNAYKARSEQERNSLMIATEDFILERSMGSLSPV